MKERVLNLEVIMCLVGVIDGPGVLVRLVECKFNFSIKAVLDCPVSRQFDNFSLLFFLFVYNLISGATMNAQSL